MVPHLSIFVCSLLLRSGGLKVRLAQGNYVGKFKVREMAESLVMTKDDLEV